MRSRFSIFRLLRQRFHFLPLPVALIVLGGCSLLGKKAPPVVEPPVLRATVRQFIGTPLSGPSVSSVPTVGLNGAIRVDVSWIAIDKVPTSKLPPLDTQSRLTVAPLSSETLLPAGMITRSARFGAASAATTFRAELQGGKLGMTSVVSSESALAVAGATTQFDAIEPPRGNKPPRRVSIFVYRSLGRASTRSATTRPATTRTEQASIAVRIDGETRPLREPASTEPSNQPVFGREIAVLDDVAFVDGSTFALLVPLQFDGTPWRALAAIVEVHATKASDRQALETLQKNLEASAIAARVASSGPAGDDNAAITSAIAELGEPRPRSPLLFLATRTDATIAADFVLVADNALLVKLADETKRNTSSRQTALPAERLGWLLDRTALELMAEVAAKPETPPEITSLLSVHAGEAGRHADSIAEIAKAVGSRKDLDLRLVGENLIYLEDNSPSSRVRAFDWLKSKGKAPQNYDPLGDPKSRRAAIEHSLNPSGGGP